MLKCLPFTKILIFLIQIINIKIFVKDSKTVSKQPYRQDLTWESVIRLMLDLTISFQMVFPRLTQRVAWAGQLASFSQAE